MEGKLSAALDCY